jgi:hypothetical protein
MSIVNQPNRNFDNETKEHVPYSVMMTGSLQSAYERFRKPKVVTEKVKKEKKKKVVTQPDAKSMKKWFR